MYSRLCYCTTTNKLLNINEDIYPKLLFAVFVLALDIINYKCQMRHTK